MVDEKFNFTAKATSRIPDSVINLTRQSFCNLEFGPNNRQTDVNSIGC